MEDDLKVAQRPSACVGIAVVIAISVLVHAGIGHCSENENVEYGIAEKYAKDSGIETDQSVVLSEGFEQLTIADLLLGWEYSSNDSRMSFSADKPAESGGSQSVFFDGSADLYTRLLPGYDQLYVRYYAKFETECNTVHHWPWFGGHNPSTAWPWPRAGTRPVGDERFSTGVEPMGDWWAWAFYTYWMHMRSSPGGNYWGNTFSGKPSPHTATRGEWICIEFMVKMNDPVSASNGEQAFWIDGVKKNHLGPGFPRGEWIWDGFWPDPSCTPSGPCNMNGSGTPCCTDFEGFQWRMVPELDLNYFWLEHYVDADSTCGVWFDDLVIATEYIGPPGGRLFSDGFETGNTEGWSQTVP
ncbi:MAG: hypothetical protein GY906_04195 [bacterium]|nr:hypothetical protein [bacterium]